MSTNAKIGFGTTIGYRAVGGTTYTNIAEITSITPAKIQVAKVNVDRFDSGTFNSLPVSDVIPGWVEPGEWEFKLNYEQAECTTLHGLVGVQKEFKVTKPDTHGYTFTGFIAEMGDEIPLKDKMETTIKVAINGGSVAAFS